MNPAPILNTVGLVHLSRGRLLLVKPTGKDAFYLPGGKPEADESERDALHREVREELATDLIPESVQWLTTVTAPAYGYDGVRVRMSCYRGELASPPRPSGEITELGYFTRGEYTAMADVAPAVVRLLAWLEERRPEEMRQSEPKGGE